MSKGIHSREVVKPQGNALRIVHACNFHYNKSGDKFDTMDARIHHGLIENSHYVYPFPVHDVARQMHWSNSKRFGARKANTSLIETCQKVEPDILLLGHTQSIKRETLEIIKRNQPSIKIAMWFCDWFYSKRAFKYEFIYDRLDLLDAFFATTAGEKLDSFNQKGCRTAFIPNMVHHAIEKYRSFERDDHEFDLIFIGTDRKDPERSATLREIEAKLETKLRIGIFGSLGRPGVYGAEKERILSRSKAALNLTRLPEPMKWYSSDRIASLMGNGVLTCTRADADLHELYGNNTMLDYTDVNDLTSKLSMMLEGDAWIDVAKNAWEISHDHFNAQNITSKMINFIFNRSQNCLDAETRNFS